MCNYVQVLSQSLIWNHDRTVHHLISWTWLITVESLMKRSKYLTNVKQLSLWECKAYKMVLKQLINQLWNKSIRDDIITGWWPYYKPGNFIYCSLAAFPTFFLQLFGKPPFIGGELSIRLKLHHSTRQDRVLMKDTDEYEFLFVPMLFELQNHLMGNRSHLLVMYSKNE